MKYSLGIDVGTSSVKVSLLEIETGACVDSSTNPGTEAAIISVSRGWAEQDPESWWQYLCDGIKDISQRHSLKEVACIGITYQMHGLVAVDSECRPVRNSIIWCDSRAVGIGEKAFEAMGKEKCMGSLLNSPGNFTASKLAWVKENEPQVYSRIWKFMLPGDYIAYRFSGKVSTTATGLSEGILWNFREQVPAGFVAEHFGIDASLFPGIVPSIGEQCRTSSYVEKLLGIPEGTPICYRAGDQPNNAFSLNVLEPGEVAATAGTSGVVYGVTDVPAPDNLSRVNTFLHVNSRPEAVRLGILLCINGTGILNSWIRRNAAPELSYPQMNELSQTAPAGSDGLCVIPFGNGAERMLGNRSSGARFVGLDLVRHSRAHLVRAVHEGIAFSFIYGMEIMKGMGLNPGVIRAGQANMFLSPVFRTTLATLSGATIELFDTDGSLGAARGGALGAGFYKNSAECFSTLSKKQETLPQEALTGPLEEAYGKWKEELEKVM